MELRKYRVKLEGLTPLIMHWDNIEWSDRMDEWRAEPDNKSKSKAGDDRSPAFRWLGCLYNDGEVVAVPYDNLSKCLMEGGVMVPTGKGKKTFKAQTQSGMRISEAYCPVIVGDGDVSMSDVLELEFEPLFKNHLKRVKELGFGLMVKRAAVGRSKHVRVRPIFKSWTLEFGIEVWDEEITENVLRRIIECAGRYKGLGDWRPSSPTPGSYGMFRLESLQSV